jgi:hypothetical protein
MLYDAPHDIDREGLEAGIVVVELATGFRLVGTRL